MGCCQSTTSGDEGPPPNEIRASTRSDAALTASRSADPNPDSDLSTPASGIIQPTATRLPQSKSTAKRPNKPIRAPSPLRTSPADVSHLSPPWTRAQLVNERTAFFETRVSGQPEVWTALRLVCELLQQGNIADAQGILDAMSITCPSGRVAIGRGRDRMKGGIYDERGELYELPAWVVTDPEDTIVSGLHERDGIASRDQGQDSSEKKIEGDNTATGEETAADRMRQREQKGKGKAADLGEQMHVRLRLSDRGTDVLVPAGSKEPVLAIVTKVRDQISAGGAERKRVRLVYLGRVLNEAKSLTAQGYRVGNVINAYVFEGPPDALRKDVIK